MRKALNGEYGSVNPRQVDRLLQTCSLVVGRDSMNPGTEFGSFWVVVTIEWQNMYSQRTCEEENKGMLLVE
jgi:hypothetical protein